MNGEKTEEGPDLRSIAALLFLALIWGASIPVTKLGLQDFPPLTLTALRYLAAAPCFLAFVLMRRRPPLRALLGMLGLGIVGIGVGQTLQALGVQRTSASVATVITAIIPILVVLLAALRLGQALRWRHALGLAAAFLGIALVAIGDPRNILAALARGSLEGDALMLLSALAISGYYGFSMELVSRYSATTVASWTSLAGAAALAPFMLWELRTEPATLRIEGICAVLYLGLLVTVLGVWIWLRALTRVPARVAASLQYLQPLVGVALSAAIFGESLDFWFGLGTTLVLAGIAIGTISSRRMPGGDTGRSLRASTRN